MSSALERLKALEAELAVTRSMKKKIKNVALKKYIDGELEKPDYSMVVRSWIEEKLKEYAAAKREPAHYCR